MTNSSPLVFAHTHNGNCNRDGFSIAEIAPDTSHQDLSLLLASVEIASQGRQGKWFDAFAHLLEQISVKRFLSGVFWPYTNCNLRLVSA